MNGGVPGDPLIYYDTLVWNGDTVVLGGVFYCTACHPYSCSPLYAGCSCTRTVTDYNDPRTGCQCTTGNWGSYDTLAKFSPQNAVDTATGNIRPFLEWRDKWSSPTSKSFSKSPNLIPNPGGKGPFYFPRFFKKGDFTDK